MDMLSIIRKKKRGEELSREEIEYMVAEFTRENGVIPDYQMSAFCMAVYFNGMTDAETILKKNYEFDIQAMWREWKETNNVGIV